MGCRPTGPLGDIMKGGFRIRHPQLSSCTLRVPMPARQAGERAKMLLIHLDQHGCAFVSSGVLDDLEWARSSGLSPHRFLVVEVLRDPPPLSMFVPQPDGSVNERAPRETHHSPRTFQQVGESVVDVAPDQSSGRLIVHWDRRKAFA